MPVSERSRQSLIIEEALRDPEAEFALGAIAAEGLHVDYGLTGVWEELGEILEVRFYAFVSTHGEYARLVRNENYKYELRHNADPRFGGQPPDPTEAYESSDELSLSVMRRQRTFVGYRESLAHVLGAATALYIRRQAA